MSDAPVTLRPVVPDDVEFLTELYASTRSAEMALAAWSDQEKADFLRMQFDAQHRYYHAHFPDADFNVVSMEGSRIGRLYVEEMKDEIRLIDIALLPPYRNRGIGTRYIHELMERAGSRGKPLRIHVEHFNPALRLYERLGFRRLEDRGVYYFMEWQPSV